MEHKMLQPFGDSYAEEKKILPKTKFSFGINCILTYNASEKSTGKKKKKNSRANAKISKLLDVMFRAATLMYSTQ